MKALTLSRNLVIGLMILLIGAFAVPGMARGTTIYVDDDNTEGPWDGTLEHPYQFIQDGVNDASDGDTAFVFNGTYYEHAVVPFGLRHLYLIGENKDETIIDGGGTDIVLSVYADQVSISGFMIRNGGSGYPNSGIYLQYSDYSTISDNIITNNGCHGILLNYSQNNVISNNTITENNYLGIYLQHSPDNIVSENTIANNSWGVDLDYADYNTISNNTIGYNSQYGIYVHASSEDTIFENDISNNQKGIFLSGGTNNNITRNDITNNGDGIYLRYSSQNTITDCNIRNNHGGVCIEYVGAPANDNIFYHNNFIGNDSQAYDECNNIWDNGYPSGGNYWSGYAGVDEDWDGIGDTPYDIPGGSNQDGYPLMYPWMGGTVFVDDDADPSWYDSIHVSTIQEGIDSVTDGGAVYIHHGIYYENVTVGKQVHLIGQNVDSVIVDGGGSGDVFSISAGSVHIRGFTVQNSGSGAGIAVSSDYNAICVSNITNNEYGIHLTDSSRHNTISASNITNNNYGITLEYSSVNTILQNDITDNDYGISLHFSSDNNHIHHNNFVNNTQSALDECNNRWDDDYPSGGNYWEDYTGNDSFWGVNQNIPGSDGIGDTPYDIGGDGNQDRYPLMNPWEDSLPTPPPMCGDVDATGEINMGDVIYIINYLFMGASEPWPVECAGNANCDTTVDVGDIIFLIGYLFLGSSEPEDCCCNGWAR